MRLFSLLRKDDLHIVPKNKALARKGRSLIPPTASHPQSPSKEAQSRSQLPSSDLDNSRHCPDDAQNQGMADSLGRAPSKGQDSTNQIDHGRPHSCFMWLSLPTMPPSLAAPRSCFSSPPIIHPPSQVRWSFLRYLPMRGDLKCPVAALHCDPIVEQLPRRV